MPRSVISVPRIAVRNLTKSIAFNGTTDYATVPVTPDVNGFNFAFWINIKTLTTNARVLDYADSGPAKGFDIGIAATNKLGFTIRDNVGIVAQIYGPQIQIGTWAFYCGTYAPNNVAWYFNGTSQGTDTSATMSAPTQTLTIAKRSASSANFSNINLNYFTFQNTTTPWTQEQINALMYNNTIPSGATQWSLDNTSLDQNGLNGLTLNGTSYSTDVFIKSRTAAGTRFLSRNMGTSIKLQGARYVNRNTIASLSTSALSLGCWINVQPNNSSFPHPIEVGGSDSATIYFVPATRIFQVKFNNIGGSAIGVNFSTAIRLGEWYHIAGIYNGSTVKCYLNAVEVGSSNRSGAITYTDSSMFVGASGTGTTPSGNYLIGSVDEAFIYNSAISVADLQNIYYNGIYTLSNLQVLWKFDEGSGTTAADSSGNSNTGTITSATYSTDVPFKARTSA